MSDSATNLIPLDRTPTAIKVDNLIRQKLRIGDPRDPAAVADGLRRLFPKDARIEDLEELGLPTLPATIGTSAPRPAESLATSAELDRAGADFETDLRALTTDHRLKDIQPELQGWGQAIRSIIADGNAAARLALDPNARDRLFGARRQLGDYARIARFVGALTPTLSVSYRKFARSLDLVSSLQLVVAGEALAGAGLGSGRFLLSVPASALQARRDAVLMALRTVAGTTEQAVGNDQWPWGLQGFQQILQFIQDSGHLDLRALLDEAVLGRALDELIERGGQQNVTGLRALGATADVTLQRLYRLLVVGARVQPAMPSLTTFLKSIQLFLDAFRSNGSGYRLLFVGRAPIAFYGLAGIGGPDLATQRLIRLVIFRGSLAQSLDCYLGCECSSEEVICQILLDKLLYDTDRAIDLYTLGVDPNGTGEPEWRAAAYGWLIRQFIDYDGELTCLGDNGVRKNLSALQDELLDGGKDALPEDDNAPAQWMIDELCLQQQSDARLQSVLAALSPSCIPVRALPESGRRAPLNEIENLIKATIAQIDRYHGTCNNVDIVPPPTTEISLNELVTVGLTVDVKDDDDGAIANAAPARTNRPRPAGRMARQRTRKRKGRKAGGN